MKPPLKDRLDWDLIKRESKDYNLSPILVSAIIGAESDGDSYVMRYEPRYIYRLNPDKYAKLNNISVETENVLQSSSLGLMQVMGAKARELKFDKSLLLLVEPEIGIELGCKYLEILVHKYSLIEDAIAAYNAGSPIYDTNGKYNNQKYVNKVLGLMKELS